MVKLMVVLHRRDGLSPDEFRHYWREHHAPLLRQLPGLTRLVFNYAQPDAAGAPPACDGISEDWFESVEALGAAFASPAGQAVAADAPNFLDLGRVQMLVVEEEEMTAPGS